MDPFPSVQQCLLVVLGGGALLRAVRLFWGSQTELLREQNSQAGPRGGPSPAHAA